MKKKTSKLENLLSPSSSWRENHNPPPRRNSNSSAVSTGCLPGFFNLFLSSFNRRKSITSGAKKKEQRTVVYASPPPVDISKGDGGRIIPPPPLPSNEGGEDPARVSLVGALEKCDRDLEELRRTIDVIKTTYLLHKKLEVSPTEARDAFKFSSSVAGDVVVGTETNKNTKRTLHETESDTMLSTMMNNTNHHEYFIKDNKTHKVNNINTTKPDHFGIHDVIANRETRVTTPIVVRKARQTLKESVNQVCDDVASGQRREVAKIGLALHDHICRDLIAETVRELSFSGYDDDKCYKLSGGGSGRRHVRRGSSNSLPLDACRRRLVF